MRQKTSRGVIKLKISVWLDHPGLPERTQCNHKSPYMREVGVREGNKGSRGQRREKMLCCQF